MKQKRVAREHRSKTEQVQTKSRTGTTPSNQTRRQGEVNELAFNPMITIPVMLGSL